MHKEQGILDQPDCLYNKVTVLVDGKKAANVIYLNLNRLLTPSAMTFLLVSKANVV